MRMERMISILARRLVEARARCGCVCCTQARTNSITMPRHWWERMQEILADMGGDESPSRLGARVRRAWQQASVPLFRK